VENLVKRGSLATERDALANAQQKNLRNDGETACGWLYWNPKSPENNPKTQQITNLLKTTKLTQKLKYRWSGSLVFTFYLPGRQFAPHCLRYIVFICSKSSLLNGSKI